jgi:hypothetical protein
MTLKSDEEGIGANKLPQSFDPLDSVRLDKAVSVVMTLTIRLEAYRSWRSTMTTTNQKKVQMDAIVELAKYLVRTSKWPPAEGH